MPGAGVVVAGERRATLAHLPALDGLRGLAVIAVLLFHAGHLPGGYLGVDLFFVLSGYLITRLLLAEHERDGGVALGAFWGRRARRLLPALLVVLVAVAAYAALALEGAELERVRRDGIATLLYLANWEALSAGRDYWSLFAAPSPLEHMWSLAIEEQFYVLWPLVVAGILRWRRSPVAVLAVAATGAVASAVWAMVLHDAGGDGARSYLGTDTRAAAILMGAALAAFVVWRGAPGRSARGGVALEVAGWVAAVGLAVAWVALSGTGDLLWRGGLAACGVAATVVIAAVSRPTTGPLGRALSFAPLRAAGLVSYGLYLWHWPVYVVLDADRTGLDGWALTALRVTVSVAFAVASFVAIERPIRRGALDGRTPALAPALAIAAPVVVGIALVAATTTGPASTTASFTGAVGESVSAERLPAEAPATATTAPPGPPTVVVVGDELAPVLADALTTAGGTDVVVSGQPGCGLDGAPVTDPAPVVDPWAGTATPLTGPCDDAGRAAAALTDELGPDVIVLAHGGDGALVRSVLGEDRRACDLVFDAWFAARLEARLDQLSATGALLALATTPPASTPPGAETETGCIDQQLRIAALARADTVVLDLARWPEPEWPSRAEGALLESLAVADAPWDLFLVGDSTALRLGEGFGTELVERPVVFGYETRLGCGILPGDTLVGGYRVDGGLCRDAVDSWFERLDDDPADVAVMLTGAWEIFDHVLLDGTTARFGSPAWDQAVRTALDRALRGLSERSEHVVALTLPCFAAGDDSGAWDLAVRNDPTRVERFNTHLRDIAAAAGVEVVDLGGLLCPGGVPLDTLDGVELRYDGVHLTREGAELVWRWLLPRLDAAPS
ncbi:MAG TPA: acyltransferase family protein [Acidimicrobiales bacterium]|nr:acyltransferase family protein [Acidimicrobiales bacterium]